MPSPLNSFQEKGGQFFRTFWYKGTFRFLLRSTYNVQLFTYMVYIQRLPVTYLHGVHTMVTSKKANYVFWRLSVIYRSGLFCAVQSFLGVPFAFPQEVIRIDRLRLHHKLWKWSWQLTQDFSVKSSWIDRHWSENFFSHKWIYFCTNVPMQHFYNFIISLISK